MQEHQLGLGHAILVARRVLPENEPFAVLLPDDGVEESCLSSMVKLYDEYQSWFRQFEHFSASRRVSHRSGSDSFWRNLWIGWIVTVIVLRFIRQQLF